MVNKAMGLKLLKRVQLRRRGADISNLYFTDYCICRDHFLTIFLTPAVFGLFYVVSAIVAFLGYFSDVGRSAALIQKKNNLPAKI